MQIEVIEESSVKIALGDLTESDALEIAETYDRYFSVIFPNPRHADHYILQARGFAGLFPLRKGRYIRVVPKVPCSCVWSMLAYTNSALSLRWWQGEICCESIENIFEFLATELMRRIEVRSHRGLQWEYESCEDRGSPVRGRILGPDPRTEWGLKFRYAKGGVDCFDNQVLLWTLYSLRFTPCSKDLKTNVDSLFRKLRAQISLVPTSEKKLKTERRRPGDYSEMHLLCRFLLAYIGPGLREGNLPSLPFAIHMPSLFEECISLWLIRSMAEKWQIKNQWKLGLEGSDSLAFRIDLALFDREGKVPLAIIDAKYKIDRVPATEDIQQVVAYAVRLGVKTAILVYPHTAIECISLRIGEVAVYSIGLDINHADWPQTGNALNRQIDQIMTHN